MRVPIGPAWPFDPAAGKLPSGYSSRLWGVWPLGQDPISWAMSVPCDADCEVLHGPAPIFDATLGRQLDALVCDQQFTYPATHPERVQWVESATFHDTASSQWAILQPAPNLVVGATFEVARLPTYAAGLLRIENIETYLRVSFPDPEIGDVVYLVTGMTSGTTSGNATSIVEPFPFPLAFPGVPSLLTWRWQLVHEWHDEDGIEPPFAVNVPEALAVPATFQPRAPWRDNRYGWGSPHARRKQITLGGTGIARLFVTLQATQDRTAFPSIRVGGSLQGFVQNAGREAAAVRDATLRLI